MCATNRGSNTATFDCAECRRDVDEFTAIAEKWGYWSDGVGELVPFCPECAHASSRPTLVPPGCGLWCSVVASSSSLRVRPHHPSLNAP